MPRFRCPSCQGLPLRVQYLPRSSPVCGRCGARLKRRTWTGPFTLAVSAVTLCLGLAAVPDLFEGAASLAARNASLPQLLHRRLPLPDPDEQPLALVQSGLFDELSQGDQAWIPVAEPLPNGGTRYRYRRRPGEPELTLAQIRARIADPPRFDSERQAISDLLQALQAAGARLVLEEPRKPGAAGEWDHAERTLRVQPELVQKGSLEFARVLNHEAIHVAQSCAGGSLEAAPVVLGLDTNLSPRLREQLADPLYAGVSAREKALEKEAYAHQERLGIGVSLIRRHCPARS